MAWSKRVGACVLVGIGGTAAASCDGVLGIREYPTLDAGAADVQAPDVCGLRLEASACGTCVQAHCCDTAAACAANSSCAAYETCLIPCGPDYACRSRCLIDRSSAAKEIPPLDACVATECAAACGLECKMTGSYAEPDAATTCEACLAGGPCSATEQCGTDADCLRALQCGTACTTIDCAYSCPPQADAGGGTLFSAYAQGEATCAGACGLGAYWDCPRQAGLLLSSISQTVVTLNLIVFPSGKPVLGATVKPCASADANCVTPILPQETSDANGNVTFTIPTVAGVVSFSGYFDIRSESTYPALYFLQAPLSVATSTLPVLLITPSIADNFYSELGVPSDPSRGIIEVQADDCHWVPAPNVAVQSDLGDAGASLGYFLNGPLARSAPATDFTGYAVLLNAPVNTPITFSLTPLARPT